MPEHHNKLTPAEAERLAILAEECGEVIQMVGKILRHGYEDFSPFDETKTPNRVNLANECGNVLCIIGVLEESEDIESRIVTSSMADKIDKLPRWTHHQPDSIKDDEDRQSRPRPGNSANRQPARDHSR